ncbi:ATP-dependent DNA helicase [Alteromonas macleodii]|uniref:ATP-dependent DNA helicase n=1 Tax=Alteromonas macleodii TaxID=28108 RepID=UPI001930912D|nr:AAA family ATPase [Alteromonas macleodii]|tara:strand:- start:1589 stop:3766 length:2178 start_codon:yes stop_codon:yes gene_type:complete
MNEHETSDKFRVTSVPHKSLNYVIFTGVPLHQDSYRVKNGKYSISVKARIESLPIAPQPGQHWIVRGKCKISKQDRNGYLIDQHTYDSPKYAECSLPETGEQLIKFIANESDFKGIGESKARALWDALGRDFHKIVRNGNDASRKRLREHLTDDSIDVLFQGYQKYANLRDFNWMSNKKIPVSVQQRLIKYHGEKTLKCLRRNPYLLMAFGMSFVQTDELARSEFSCKLDDENRLSAALEAVLFDDVKRGNTYTPPKLLRANLIKLLNDKDLVELAFKAGYNKAQYLLNPDTGNFHQTATLLMESVIAKRLLKLANSTTSRFDEKANKAYRKAILELPYELTEKQHEAVTTCLGNDISCITGGAGTGKTTVLRTAVRAFDSLKYQIHAAALSGRAAMRLRESIGFDTTTIAGFLRNKPIVPCEKQPLHLLVVDEASMIDVPTMYRIVNHVHPSVRIILSGDPDQLPPIGCGKVLADVVKSNVIKNTALDIVKRQDGPSGIPEYSKKVNSGQVPLELSIGNIFFHETEKKSIVDQCTKLYAQSPSSSRVMAPTRKLVEDLNAGIQKTCNFEGELLQFMMDGDSYYQNLRRGDEILFTQNSHSLGFQNGSLGKLISVEFDEERKLYGKIELDTGEIIDITQSVLDCIELGYAITLHKAQGSQFPRIIVAVTKGRITDRAWLYTAITRAETEVHLVGSAEEFEIITKNISNANRRRSFLLTLLKNHKN